MNRKAHWQRVYTTKAADAVSWFQAEPTVSAQLLDGSVIIATFGPKGPLRCSGLPTLRYAPEDLETELGSRFRLRESIREVHPTPSGTTQDFWYSRFTLT